MSKLNTFCVFFIFLYEIEIEIKYIIFAEKNNFYKKLQ